MQQQSKELTIQLNKRKHEVQELKSELQDFSLGKVNAKKNESSDY